MSTVPIPQGASVGVPIPSGAQIGEQKEQPGFLDKEIPLSSYGNATLSGLQSIGRGVRSAGEGLYNTFRHPIDTVRGIASLPSQAAEIPAAIHDINQSPDPVGTYAKAAQETAGQGAGQALTALATEGIARGIPKVARAVKPIVRVGLKTASDIVDPDVTGIASPRLAHAQRLAGRLAEKMEAKPVYPGAHLPEAPDPGVLHGPDELPITNVLHGPDELPITNALHGPEAPEPITNAFHGPEKPPVEVLKARGLQLGGRAANEPAAGLGRIPLRAEAPAPEVSNIPEMPFGGQFDKIPETIPEKGIIPGSREDIAETKGIQEAAREMGEHEDRARLSAAKSDWFKRNAPGKTKGELTGTAKPPSNPLAGKRMDFSESKSASAAPGKGVRGVRIVPGANEDLTPLLKKSLAAVKKVKSGD